MGAIRTSARFRPITWAIVIVLALAARLLVPAGFMPDWVGTGTYLVPCSGHGAMAMPGGRPMHGEADRGKADQPCGFGALGDAVTGASAPDPIFAKIAFTAPRRLFVCVRQRSRTPRRLRPPLRAPPAAAMSA